MISNSSRLYRDQINYVDQDEAVQYGMNQLKISIRTQTLGQNLLRFPNATHVSTRRYFMTEIGIWLQGHYVLLPRNRQRMGIPPEDLFKPTAADEVQMNQVHEMELYERAKSWTYALLSGINDHYHRIRTELENEKVLIKGPNDFLCIVMYLRTYTHIACRTIDALSFVKVITKLFNPCKSLKNSLIATVQSNSRNYLVGTRTK